MDRDQMLRTIGSRRDPWDMIVIGGGATGLGIAVDAAARGLDVVLFERDDFAKGTSSRSTKLIHGGVRYLQQGNISLVMEALRERGILRANAPHLVHDLAFVVPSYEWWESPFYGVGLKVYDLLAGQYGFGRSSHLSRDEVVAAIPNIDADGLRGGTRYFDGQFDDARLALALARTAVREGATVLNHANVRALRRDRDGALNAVEIEDRETGERFDVPGRVVINATGPFSDEIRRLDRPHAKPIIEPSQGVHLVVDRSYLAGESAIMVPHTSDGRVIFIIPWNDVVVIGTTDTPIEHAELDPAPRADEIEFLVETANRYLARDLTSSNIRAAFTGVRPLVRPGGADDGDTAAISREHAVLIDPASGLVTIAGGKWTTYRRMAKDAVAKACIVAGIDVARCRTRELRIHGYHEDPASLGALAVYGTDAALVTAIARTEPELAIALHPELPVSGAQVAYACREEMARTIEDVLARRTRAMLLDARASIETAPAVAAIMARELDRSADWIDAELDRYRAVASRSVWPPVP